MAHETKDDGRWQEILAAVAGRAESERERELAKQLLERCQIEVGWTDLERLGPEVAADAVSRLLRLGFERQPGALALDVYDAIDAEQTVIQVVNDDMPFLLATITGLVQQRSRRAQVVVHPIMSVARESDGSLVGFESGGSLESWIHLTIDRVSGEAGRAELASELREALELNRVAVDDWSPMKVRVGQILERLRADPPPPVGDEELAEARDFLEWLLDDHFTFLGFRHYRLVSREDDLFLELDPESGLGVLRDVSELSRARSVQPLPERFQRSLRRGSVVSITKASRRSQVHRMVHMDAIGIRCYDEEGRVVGEDRFVGLFTSSAYGAAVRSVPIVRQKVRHIEDRAGFTPASHDGKSLTHILDSFPRDEIFQIGEGALYRMAIGILRLQQRPRVALFARADEFERFVSCLVYVPRERYRFELRQRIRRVLENAFQGQVTAFYVQLGDQALARVHYIVKTTPGQVPDVDIAVVEKVLEETAMSWGEHLREHLVRRDGEGAGIGLHERWGEAFPKAYHLRAKAKEALPDIDVLERMRTGDRRFDARLSRPLEPEHDELHLKLFSAGRHIALSDAMPILEHLGLRIEAEFAAEVRSPDGESVWIHEFEIRSSEGVPLDEATYPELEETLRRVWSGELDSGTFNRLVVAGGLDWRQVVTLRAYSRYLRQSGLSFSQTYMAEVLVDHASIARRLVELFEILFDPDHRDGFRPRAAAVLSDIRGALDAVRSVDEDRILRAFLAVIKATIRTNFYQMDAEGRPKSYLSFKLDSSSIRHLPEPRPRFEIFVYSPRVEGIHLRGGLVARGGIRWSDRREDFRTEVLGLLKAQMVKNAVIVPVGAKGGFVVKKPPTSGGRQAFQREGVACYTTFIRGLLDLTDNIVKGEIVPPERVVRRDGDDTYLVVAADKGTATFSDIANSVAKSYGFWLGDAFASGGSAGYDHKKMGITARGAWEAVKRHFRELGRNIQKESFSVVGVGDMSGDVFGNGMLLSKQTHLVGAFNHLHIFVDPDPDPKTSWEERSRLFELPRSTWLDYDREKLSAGGGVFERAAKWLDITPEIQDRFGLDKRRVSPNDLIRALVTSEVDLLWFGGIGTFVRASTERNLDVGDRANDAIRVEAGELRCRVVGEGANLGITQAARIEYGLAGGKSNTDAIDNSGGVDCSDHEVNIKIALDGARARRKLNLKNRNVLLEEMTEEVAALVLRDNYLQTQALSLAEARGAEVLTEQTLMIRDLERRGKLDRELEGLPSDEELLARAADRRGLTRPELAVLIAYSKIDLYESLVASDLPDDDLLENDLMRYFPGPVREGYATFVASHRLRREIIATFTTNSTINRVGPSFVFRMTQATGHPAADVARAFTITRDGFDLRKVWTAVEALDNRVPAAVQLEMLTAANRLTEHVTLWFLRRFEGSLDVSEVVRTYRPALRELGQQLGQLVPAPARRELKRRAASLVKRGVPERLAGEVAGLKWRVAGPDIVRAALNATCDVETAARVYFAVGEEVGISWLRAAANRLDVGSGWEQAAVRGVVDNLYRHQSAITGQILASAGDAPTKRRVEGWLDGRRAAVERLRWLMEEMRRSSEASIAMLTVANQQLEQTVGAGGA